MSIDFVEQEQLKQKSYTSFGKLILADEFSQPIWSMGKANRFTQMKKLEPINRKKSEMLSASEEKRDDTKFKYNIAPKWKFGNGLRPPLYEGECFEYFNHPYNEADDLGKLPKKWNRTQGGAMALEPRVKYDFREGVPGPGRYEPNDKVVRHKDPAFYIGEKVQSLSLKLLTGTDDKVGPGTYDFEDREPNDHEFFKKDQKILFQTFRPRLTSIHRKYPHWSLGKDKRKGLFNQTWTKNETYEEYSSVGKQIRTHKRSEAEISIGKSTRDGEKFRGVFPQMMARQPAQVRIPLPKF